MIYKEAKGNMETFMDRFYKIFGLSYLPVLFVGKNDTDKPLVKRLLRWQLLLKQIRRSKTPRGTESKEMPFDDFGKWWNHQGGIDEIGYPLFSDKQAKSMSAALESKIRQGKFPKIAISLDVTRALGLLSIPNFNHSLVTGLIERDPTLTNELVRIANIFQLASATPVQDLKQALTRLGGENLRILIYLLTAKANFSDERVLSELGDTLTEHCLSTGIIAHYLAQHYYASTDEAFTAGIMHDIGKLGILNAISKLFELPGLTPQPLTEKTFSKIFESSHEKIGRHVIGRWELPARVVLAASHHHDFLSLDRSFWEPHEETLCHLVYLSSLMARALGKGAPLAAMNLLDTPSAKALGMKKDINTAEILDKIPELIRSTEQQDNDKITAA